jgi:SAM-dependent methyltransferase
MAEEDFYNHANSRNPIIRVLVNGYLRQLAKFLGGLNISSELDVGCGSAYVTDYISHLDHNNIFGLDISPDKIDLARSLYPRRSFIVGDGRSIPFQDNQFDLVVATEVLEHQQKPEDLMKEIYRVSSRYAFISVPDDFIWRMGNLIRGKYLDSWGNCEGHVQHWDRGSLEKFLGSFFPEVEVKRCCPWLMALCKKN